MEVYLEDETLFALWPHEITVLAYKATEADLLLSFDLVLAALAASSVTVASNNGFHLPSATRSNEAGFAWRLVKKRTPARTRVWPSLSHK